MGACPVTARTADLVPVVPSRPGCSESRCTDGVRCTGCHGQGPGRDRGPAIRGGAADPLTRPPSRGPVGSSWRGRVRPSVQPRHPGRELRLRSVERRAQGCQRRRIAENERVVCGHPDKLASRGVEEEAPSIRQDGASTRQPDPCEQPTGRFGAGSQVTWNGQVGDDGVVLRPERDPSRVGVAERPIEGLAESTAGRSGSSGSGRSRRTSTGTRRSCTTLRPGKRCGLTSWASSPGGSVRVPITAPGGTCHARHP